MKSKQLIPVVVLLTIFSLAAVTAFPKVVNQEEWQVKHSSASGETISSEETQNASINSMTAEISASRSRREARVNVEEDKSIELIGPLPVREKRSTYYKSRRHNHHGGFGGDQRDDSGRRQGGAGVEYRFEEGLRGGRHRNQHDKSRPRY